jgi:hypothetical protein
MVKEITCQVDDGQDGGGTAGDSQEENEVLAGSKRRKKTVLNATQINLNGAKIKIKVIQCSMCQGLVHETSKFE